MGNKTQDEKLFKLLLFDLKKRKSGHYYFIDEKRKALREVK